VQDRKSCGLFSESNWDVMSIHVDCDCGSPAFVVSSHLPPDCRLRNRKAPEDDASAWPFSKFPPFEELSTFHLAFPT
jgi:hypothetical protein